MEVKRVAMRLGPFSSQLIQFRVVGELKPIPSVIVGIGEVHPGQVASLFSLSTFSHSIGLVMYDQLTY